MDLAKESVYWGARVMIIGIALVFLLFVIGSLINYKVEINEIRSYVIRNKIILDEECLAYKDYRVHLGEIDKNKFDVNRIINCLNTDVGIILNLTYNKNSESISINNDLVDKRVLCFDEETFLCVRKGYNLILKDNSQEIPSKLIIDTIALR